MDTRTKFLKDIPIKDIILEKISPFNLEFEEDALYFFNFYCKIADENANKEISIIKSKIIIKRRPRTGGLPIRGNPIDSSIYKLKKRREIEKIILDKNKASEKFSKILIEESENKLITSNSLYRTLKKLCPIWPFC